MATALEIVNDSLATMGVNNPTASQQQQQLRWLQDFISSVSAEDLTIHSNTEDTKTLTASTGSYTYGTSGDINSARPVTIVHAFIRDTNGDDTPLTEISEQLYDDIGDKDTESLPTKFFYNASYSKGTIYLYPVPDLSTYVLHLKVRKKIATLTALTDTISLPDEYIRYLKKSLVLDTASLYGYQPSREDILLQQRAEQNVKTVNRRVIERKVPSELLAF